MLASCISLPVNQASSGGPADKTGWKLVYRDEFDGTELDSYLWSAVDKKWPYSHEEEFYTSRPENLRVSDGNLVITALRESYQGAQYTSARIESKDKIQDVYGYIEARIKMPFGKGMWPAFWLLMEPSVYPSYYGEIDIVEVIGGGFGMDNVVHATAHYGDGAAIVSRHSSTSIQWPAKLSDAYHIYAIEWAPGYIKWFLDGVEFNSVDITPENQEELRSPQYLIFNIAVGGDWGGTVDATTVFPQRMYVDWVRWWKKESADVKPGKFKKQF